MQTNTTHETHVQIKAFKKNYINWTFIDVTIKWCTHLQAEFAGNVTH